MLTDSLYVICGEGYNGVAGTLEAAHALAERMDGGTVYVKVERLASLEAAARAVLAAYDDGGFDEEPVFARLRSALERLATEGDA